MNFQSNIKLNNPVKEIILKYYDEMKTLQIIQINKRLQKVFRVTLDHYKMIHSFKKLIMPSRNMSAYFVYYSNLFPSIGKDKIIKYLLYYLKEYSKTHLITVSSVDPFSSIILKEIPDNICLHIVSKNINVKKNTNIKEVKINMDCFIVEKDILEIISKLIPDSIYVLHFDNFFDWGQIDIQPTPMMLEELSKFSHLKRIATNDENVGIRSEYLKMCKNKFSNLESVRLIVPGAFRLVEKEEMEESASILNNVESIFIDFSRKITYNCLPLFSPIAKQLKELRISNIKIFDWDMKQYPKLDKLRIESTLFRGEYPNLMSFDRLKVIDFISVDIDIKLVNQFIKTNVLLEEFNLDGKLKEFNPDDYTETGKILSDLKFLQSVSLSFSLMGMKHTLTSPSEVADQILTSFFSDSLSKLKLEATTFSLNSLFCHFHNLEELVTKIPKQTRLKLKKDTQPNIIIKKEFNKDKLQSLEVIHLSLTRSIVSDVLLSLRNLRNLIISRGTANITTMIYLLRNLKVFTLIRKISIEYNMIKEDYIIDYADFFPAFYRGLKQCSLLEEFIYIPLNLGMNIPIRRPKVVTRCQVFPFLSIFFIGNDTFNEMFQKEIKAEYIADEIINPFFR